MFVVCMCVCVRVRLRVHVFVRYGRVISIYFIPVDLVAPYSSC